MTSVQRVLQLPKFAVVEVMLDLNGRDQLNSDKWEVRDRFWRAVLARLNDLYPENQSEVRTVNHVKRTWCALKQRVLARAKTAGRETLPSDRKVLYLLQVCDSYDEDAPISMDRLEQRLNPEGNANNDQGPCAHNGYGSGEEITLPKNIDPLLDSMILCGGRQALPKKRATTMAGKAEYRHFWDKVHMLLQFNPQCAGRSILSFQRAWYNIRMYFSNKLKKNDKENSPRERKALYLMRILSLEQAGLQISNGSVKDLQCENGIDEVNGHGKVELHSTPTPADFLGQLCEVVKQEPLDLAQLIGAAKAVSQPDDEINTDNDASSSVYDALQGQDQLDLLTALTPQPSAQHSSYDNSEPSQLTDEAHLRQRLLICQIERERAQTELLKAQKRFIEAQLQGVIDSDAPTLKNASFDGF